MPKAKKVNKDLKDQNVRKFLTTSTESVVAWFGRPHRAPCRSRPHATQPWPCSSVLRHQNSSIYTTYRNVCSYIHESIPIYHYRSYHQPVPIPDIQTIVGYNTHQVCSRGLDFSRQTANTMYRARHMNTYTHVTSTLSIFQNWLYDSEGQVHIHFRTAFTSTPLTTVPQ